MKGKTRLFMFAFLAVVLTCTVLFVGCGKNPFAAVLGGLGAGGNVKVAVGKL